MLPVMVASGFSGLIAGLLVSRLGLREVATGGMLLSAFSFLGLALTDFRSQPWQAWGLMTLLGFSVASALLASSSARLWRRRRRRKQRRPGRSKPWPMNLAPVSALRCSA